MGFVECELNNIISITDQYGMKFMTYGAMSFIVKDGRMSARRMTCSDLKLITA